MDTQNHQDQKYRRYHESGQIGKFSYKGDLWDKAAVLCLVHQRTEQDQQARHHPKYSQ